MTFERIPHDQFFKRMKSDLRVAKDFFATHLSDRVKHTIMLDTLKTESASFISKELMHHRSDMLYRVKLQKDNPAYLYLLVEYQSRVDELMPIRIIRYIVNIIERYLRYENNNVPLTLVFSLVFHNRKKSHDSSCELLSLFGVNKELARDIFMKPFTFIDIAKIEDEEIPQHQWSVILEGCMRHIHEREIKQFLSAFGHLFHILAVKKQDDAVVSVVKYVIASMKTREQRQQLLRECGQKQRNMATIAEVFYNEGVQEGKEQGVQQGLNKRLHRAMLAIDLIFSGEDNEQIAVKTGLDLELVKVIREKITD